MQIIHKTKHTIQLPTLPNVEFELEEYPRDKNDLRAEVVYDSVIFGFTNQDEDCQNPCTASDGVGFIYSFNRRHANFVKEEELAELQKTPFVVPLSYYEHGLCLWDVEGGERIGNCPDMQWDGRRFAGIWVPDESCLDHINDDDYFPGYDMQCVDGLYSLKAPDGTTLGEFDGYAKARKAIRKHANPVDTAVAIEARRWERARGAAQDACRAYTAWCNGQCYRISVQVFDLEGVCTERPDGVNGVYGYDAAAEELEAEMQIYIDLAEKRRTIGVPA